MKKILCLCFLHFSVLLFAQSEKNVIQSYLDKNKERLGLETSDINDWSVQSKGNSDGMGTDNYYIIQQYNGTEIFKAVSSVAVKNGSVFYYANNFKSKLSSSIKTVSHSLSATTSLNKVLTLLGFVPTEQISIVSAKDEKHLTLSNGFGQDDLVLANLVYLKNKEGQYILCWDFTIHTPDHKHMWSIQADANTGVIVVKTDMMISCNFSESRSKSCNHQNIKLEPKYDKKLAVVEQRSYSTSAPLAASYRVVPFNVESPIHGSFQLIANPAILSASPKEWHDINTINGNLTNNKFTYLKGNNVWARADYGNSDPTVHSSTATSNGYSPTSAGLVFDYPYGGTAVASSTYINASTTNLFYMNNMIHDVWYQYGFNEVNGNFQQQNYGKGGAGADFVWADAHDGFTASPQTLNNANFGTPVDGQKPRMQMFLWNRKKLTELLTVNLPADIAGGKIASDNAFNPGHVDIPIAPALIETNLVLFDDGSPDVGQTDNADACSPAVNAAAINGKIVVIRRSTSLLLGGNPCSFADKALNGKLAGAAAVVIVNNDLANPNFSIGMSGANSDITIPVISISSVNGEAIISKLKAGQVVNAKIQSAASASPFINADGSFDNGVISHEYGHGISNRLAGGPGNSSCLNNYDQMGEGWSDWFALMMQLKSGDVATARRGIGNFVLNLESTDDGLRSYPYTTNMSINPLTYNNSNSPVPEEAANTGYRYVNGDFWATCLWDLTWAYINKYGFDANIFTGVGGNNKVMRLVLDGLKLQPCGPTVVSARDALFAAEQATSGGVDYCMIAEVFRRRGVGKDATAGSPDDCNDQIENFTPFAAAPNCQMPGLSLNYFDKSNINIFPNPSGGIFNLRINQYFAKLNVQVLDLNGRVILDNKSVDFSTEAIIDLSDFQSGVYVIKLTGDNLNYSQKIIKN